MEQAPRCEPAIRSSLLSGGFIVLAVIAVLICGAASVWAADGKPNILVIWGDDIGRDNISAYSLGIMGYQTPNIDRLAKEGALFTDSYAQQSCTAGRASFILGSIRSAPACSPSACRARRTAFPIGRRPSPTC